ncbi:FIST C-terminal domain-containing protein [Heliobacterium chlorum]|uniref:FIST C-terminal domain-containing protein n=1 Tax=Heliobacterium chlorum TaxID=2698 RepID=A0ABR7SZU8_HELCL|nr:FIST C-terminal domain-containing protein [Heliobacterium chlorum]MBC9784068.1 FIST C-terminal domain-containing protein [Heliobacterium chlorum]
MYKRTFRELADYIAQLDILPSEQLMILTADKSSHHVPELINLMNSKNMQFFGGVYAALLSGNKMEREGFIVQKYEPLYCSIVLPFLMRFNLDPKDLENTTALVLVDGLSSKFKDLTDTVYNKVGSNVTYIGGGAGHYDLQHRPCIYDHKGIYKDVLYICIVKGSTELAVEHGWRKMDGPFTITQSNGNTLAEIDYQNAFDVYKDIIEQEENLRISKEDFFSFAKDHPFGIQEKGHFEIVVRDPIGVNDNDEIVCIADIPKGSQVYVLKGNANTLLASSIQIAEYCAKRAPAKYRPLLFDCISRAMFLEERFDSELSNIQAYLKYPVEGALSIGEIASRKNGEIIIHNKSTILGLLSFEENR